MSKNLETLTNLLDTKSLNIAVAESCTGGLLSATLTSQSGASNYFDRGYITYSNQAKKDTLGVQSETLECFGAVSEQTALEMVAGVEQNSGCDVCVSITGIAGPTGGSKKKPVGMVCFGFCLLGQCWTTTQYFSGSRKNIVENSIDFVLKTLIEKI